VPAGSEFRHWQPRRALAAWDWIELEGFPGPKTLEPVWLAMARTRVEVASPRRQLDAAFAVRVSLRTPPGATPVLGRLIKGIMDGVVCAFQAHTDKTSVGALAVRVARSLPAQPLEVERLLLDGDKAVLGSVARLLHARGNGVIWAPADDFCLAGELLVEGRLAKTWGLRGTIVELDARPNHARPG
jgi:hypothetical protein